MATKAAGPAGPPIAVLAVSPLLPHPSEDYPRRADREKSDQAARY
jgi:hypothetical protein